jgi:hypothetical protein
MKDMRKKEMDTVDESAAARRKKKALRQQSLMNLQLCRDPNGPGGKRGGYPKGKINAILSDQDRIEYEAMLSRPGVTHKQALQWLRNKGYRVGHVAVARHHREFMESLKQLRYAARFADALGQLSDKHGSAALSDVTLTRVQQLVMERLFSVSEVRPAEQAKESEESDKSTDTESHKPKDTRSEERRMSTAELAALSKIVEGAVGSRKHIEQMRREFQQTKQRTAEEADKVAQSGADGQAVVNRVREILGIPLGDDRSELEKKDGLPQRHRDTEGTGKGT